MGMAATNDDRTSRALDILRSAPFSTAVNGFVLPSDVFYRLLGVLEGDDAADEPADDAEPEKKAGKRGHSICSAA